VRRLLLLAFIWGWSFLLIKVILRSVPPTFLAWGRIVLGFAVLLVFLRAGQEHLPQLRAWGHLLVLGMAMSVMPFTVIAWGEERITSALTSVLNACTPLFTAAFAAWLLRERLRAPQLAGLGIAFFGVAVLAGLGGGDLAASSLVGALAIVLGAAGYGFGFAYARRFMRRLTPMQLSAGQLGAASLLLLPVAGANLATGHVHFNWLGVLCLFLLGTLGTGYGYLLNYRTLQEHGATTASLVTYLVPIVGVAAGVLVLGEPFSYRLLIGGLIVVLGIALTQGLLLGPRAAPSPAAVAARPRAGPGAATAGPPKQPGHATCE
jgi:drug/metabolite transporter (DMT)-like permease